MNSLENNASEKSGFFDCEVKMPFSLMPGHPTLLQGSRLPQWKQQKLSKTSDPAEPAMRKLGALQLAGRKEIPHSEHFPASLTRKNLTFIPPPECFFQLDDCARIKEILPFHCRIYKNQQFLLKKVLQLFPGSKWKICNICTWMLNMPLPLISIYI